MLSAPSKIALKINNTTNPITTPIRTCVIVTNKPSALIGSTAGTSPISGAMLSEIRKAAMTRIRIGICWPPKTGRTLNKAATRINGHQKLPTKAVISAVVNTGQAPIAVGISSVISVCV